MKKELETPELTRVSSKGQIVIPTSIRKKLSVKKGSVFAVTAKKDIIVLKKLDMKMKSEDLKILKLIEEAWEDIEKGRYKVYSREAFFKELKKW
ncbi:MAG: AbrB/MazE/SpoVT family DNA-binding domain-containing protein [Candidatus Omnitrophica bacterium]|nr:AbrB/MazE/SpoVT family DNA-binding domain-containing protein [Candidatus Omnitrophota bacterium]